MERKIPRIAMWVAIIAVYLNIGWALGTYYHNNIFNHPPQTVAQQVLSGAGHFLTNQTQQHTSLLEDQTVMMFFWPVMILLVVIGSWLGYALYWLLWLVFAGGIVKIFGVG